MAPKAREDVNLDDRRNCCDWCGRKFNLRPLRPQNNPLASGEALGI
jgi:hypothetical protein